MRNSNTSAAAQDTDNCGAKLHFLRVSKDTYLLNAINNYISFHEDWLINPTKKNNNNKRES